MVKCIKMVKTEKGSYEYEEKFIKGEETKKYFGE